MALRWPAKDPDEVLDFTIDWSDRIASGDTISSSTWTLPDGLTSASNTRTTTTTTVWISGGTVGTDYTVLNRVVTTAGRTMDQSVKLKIKTK